MAIISTGLGSVSDSDSTVSQTFKISPYAKILSFKYNVISEEPMEYVHSKYDDKFQASLTDESGSEMTLAYSSVNDASWTGFGGDIFADGDATTYQTGWNIIEKDVSSLAGKSVTLTFLVWDVGDSSYDTAALIDDVKLY